MNIEEGNKLIAEFMGWIYVDEYSHWYDPKWERYTHLIYHTSWDWIVPVLQKISEIFKIDTENKTPDYNKTGGIVTWTTPMMTQYMKINFGIRNLDISKVYSEVVEFIKWYNENN